MRTFITFMLLIIARSNAEMCSSKYYRLTREGGPSLLPEETISSHKLGHNVKVSCTILCHNEKKCIGFNFRTQFSDENCQLTNVGTAKKNVSRRGEWTLYLFGYPQCFEYKWLNESNRYLTYSNRKRRICDKDLSPGWYRFGGGAGTKLSTTCVGHTMCGTTAPGWMSGALPTVAQGKVTRRVFYFWKHDCYWKSSDIEVVNCGNYYVYKLAPPPSCNLRYCGSRN